MVGRDYSTARTIPKASHWEDLIDQDEIDVGFTKGGSTQSFFEVDFPSWHQLIINL